MSKNIKKGTFIYMKKERHLTIGEVGEFSKKQLLTHEDCMDEFIAELIQIGFTEAVITESKSRFKDEYHHYPT